MEPSSRCSIDCRTVISSGSFRSRFLETLDKNKAELRGIKCLNMVIACSGKENAQSVMAEEEGSSTMLDLGRGLYFRCASERDRLVMQPRIRSAKMKVKFLCAVQHEQCNFHIH